MHTSRTGLALLASVVIDAAVAVPGPIVNPAANLNIDKLFNSRSLNTPRAVNDTSSSGSGLGKSKFPKEATFAVDYYPSQWPRSMWESDAQGMVEAGLTYVRIGEFDWALLEPTEGNYDFEFMDSAIEVLGAAGLQVILGTPTATPPIWVSENYDILPADANRTPRGFGSRRHYSTSSPDYRKLSRSITTKLAERYGKNKHVTGWQLDNEFGCHGTVRTFDKHACKAFGKWLQAKYKDVTTMNTMQGRVFWSSDFQTFDQVDCPTQEVTESSPALRLDWMEFSSDQTISFAKEQIDIIRKYTKPTDFIHTNFMGYFMDFDHHKFAAETGIDLATWDSYPLGNLEQFPFFSDARKIKYARTGDPDSQALNHAIYRGVAGAAFGESSGYWGTMEMQPGGPVNWAPHNPSPALGMLRLWIHEILAGSGTIVGIFRWREVPFAQEQMHAGLYRRDNEPDEGLIELNQVVQKDIPALLNAGLVTVSNTSVHLKPAPQAEVAFIMDYAAGWATEAEPQGGIWSVSQFTNYPFIWVQLLHTWYSALRRLSLHVDVIGPDTSLAGYKLVIVPTMPLVSDKFNARLKAFNGSVVFGPRSASKVATLSIPDGLPPAKGAVRDRLPMKVIRVESLRDDIADQVSYEGKTYPVTAWSEWLECKRGNTTASLPAEATFSGYRDGKPATCGHTTESGHTTRYVGYYADSDFLTAYLGKAAAESGAKDILGRTPSSANDLGADIRLSHFAGSGAVMAVNYGNASQAIPGFPSGAQVALGSSGNSSQVEPYGVTIFTTS